MRLFGLLRVLADVVAGRRGPRAPRSTAGPPTAVARGPAGGPGGRRSRSPWSAGSSTWTSRRRCSPTRRRTRALVITCAGEPDDQRAAAARVADGDRGWRDGRGPQGGGGRAAGRRPRPGALRGRPAPARPAGGRRPARRALPHRHPGARRPGPTRVVRRPFPALPMTLAHVLTDDGELFCGTLARGYHPTGPNPARFVPVSAVLTFGAVHRQAPLQLRQPQLKPPPQFPLRVQLLAQHRVLGVLRLHHGPQPRQQLTLLRDHIRQAGLLGHEPQACSTCTKGSNTKRHQRVTSDRCAVVTSV